MKNLILVDGHNLKELYPLTLTRPASHLRCGILTIREKWEKVTQATVSTYSLPLFNAFWSPRFTADNILVNSAVLPDESLIEKIGNLRIGDSLEDGGMWMAARLNQNDSLKFLVSGGYGTSTSADTAEHHWVKRPEDLITFNNSQIRRDFKMITRGRTSRNPDESNFIRGDQLFIEEDAKIYNSIINTEDGPVYIGRNVVILEGSIIKGPCALGESTVLKMGAKIYGATSTGPHCKLGGEVKNSLFQAFSSKGHDGYIGDSFIGAWCNFGAGSCTSNMKNTYGQVRLYDMASGVMRDTGRQFLGVIMGDHSKCAINTAFSTGTVVGVFANIFNYHPKGFVQSYSWGRDDRYRLEKAIDVARKAMMRKEIELADLEIQILSDVFNNSIDD